MASNDFAGVCVCVHHAAQQPLGRCFESIRRRIAMGTATEAQLFNSGLLPFFIRADGYVKKSCRI